MTVTHVLDSLLSPENGSDTRSPSPPSRPGTPALPPVASSGLPCYGRPSTCLFKLSAPEGFAIQRLYSKDGRIDKTLTVRHNDLILVREGYHPLVAGPGYHCYYLNVLAGDVRTMQASDDPTYAWIRETWGPRETNSPLDGLIGGKG